MLAVPRPTKSTSPWLTNRPHCTTIRYQADENPPAALALGLGLQLAILCIAGVVLTPVIVVRAAGAGEDYLSWAVFAAVAISGATTILQAVRVGPHRFRLRVYSWEPPAPSSLSARQRSPRAAPAMLATLVVISSLFQFALSARLSLLRRILTPTVAGTVLMLIPVTVMPIVFDMLSKSPGGNFSARRAGERACHRVRHPRNSVESKGRSASLGAGYRRRRGLGGRGLLWPV